MTVWSSSTPRRRPDAEDASDDDVGRQEEQDDGLDDVDDLDRDAGQDLHQAGAGPQRAEQEGGEQDADRVRPAEQGDRDRVEPDRGAVGRRS